MSALSFCRHVPNYCHIAAITSLRGALWSLLRNLLAVSFLYGFCYGAMLVRKVKIRFNVNCCFTRSVVNCYVTLCFTLLYTVWA